MQPADRDYAQSDEIVDACMEWIGMRWTKSMMKRELRKIAALYLSDRTCSTVIRAAEAKIRKLYGIDPQYYKGIQIAFYEFIIRKQGEKTKDKLTAAERLDRLFGLEQISGDDPEVTARKIREELKAMDASMNLGDIEDGGDQESAEENKQRSEDGGEGKNESGDNVVEKTTKEQEYISEEGDDVLPQDVKETLDNIPKKDIERFRKDRKERGEV